MLYEKTSVTEDCLCTLLEVVSCLFDQEHYGLPHIENNPATFPRITVYSDSLSKQFLGENVQKSKM